VLHVNPSIEEHASKVYTRAMFEQFGHRKERSGSRVVFQVKLVDDGEFFECECCLAHGDCLMPCY
jgi:hypothetical protein